MSYFQTLKDQITCRDAAEKYGLEVNRSGMARCPFHEDRNPSMKLSRGFHCFGCGAQGDVITFVSRLFEISSGDAARRLAADFDIPLYPRGPPAAVVPDSGEDLMRWGSSAKEILHHYYDLLVLWKQELRPANPDDPCHPLFVEALQKQEDIREMIHILEFGSRKEQQEIYNYYRKTVKLIDRKLRTHAHERDLPESEERRQRQGSPDHR